LASNLGNIPFVNVRMIQKTNSILSFGQNIDKKFHICVMFKTKHEFDKMQSSLVSEQVGWYVGKGVGLHP
jgi:hypothetical protein